MIIHKFNKTFIGKVLNRPAKENKSPYLLNFMNNKKYIGQVYLD